MGLIYLFLIFLKFELHSNMWSGVMNTRCWLLVFVIYFSLAGIVPVSSGVVEIAPPLYVKLGEHRFNITVYCEDRVVWDSIVLVVNVFGSYSLQVYFPEFPSPFFSITSGESKSFTVTFMSNLS